MSTVSPSGGIKVEEFAKESCLENRPNQEEKTSTGIGLRRRVGKMVPRISGDFMSNGLPGRRRRSSESSEPRANVRGNDGETGGMSLVDPIVEFEDPLKAETSFSHKQNQKAPSSENLSLDLLSPTDDISLTSDDSREVTTNHQGGSFNSTNLYRPVFDVDNDFSDDGAEGAMLLPNAEFGRMREGDKDVSITVTTEERAFSIALQVFFPFMIAGIGTVGAGLLLDVVQVQTNAMYLLHDLTPRGVLHLPHVSIAPPYPKWRLKMSCNSSNKICMTKASAF